jgi:hypothetical protein
MSTHFQVFCLECRDEGGCYINRGLNEARLLVRHAKALVGLEALRRDSSQDLTLSFFSDQVDLFFFETHGNHRLIACSEYGVLDGQCRDYTAGPKGKMCTLDDGHAGPHVSDKTSERYRGW